MTSHIATNHNKKKSCLLFYVYSYCCGKCTGIIAIILAFTETSSVHARALLVVALTLSVLSFLAHVVISRRPQTPTLVLMRTTVVSSGLLASSASVGFAAYYTWKSVSLLFVCCILFSAIYLLACIGYIINVKLHWKGGPTTDAPMSAGGPLRTSLALVGESAILRQIYYMSCNDSARQTPCTTDPEAALRTGVIFQLPAYEEDLPSYEQLYSSEPPKYSEEADAAAQIVTTDRDESPLPEADYPPKYEDVVLTVCGSDVNVNGDSTVDQQK